MTLGLDMLGDENMNRRVDTDETNDEVLWGQPPPTPSHTAFTHQIFEGII